MTKKENQILALEANENSKKKVARIHYLRKHPGTKNAKESAKVFEEALRVQEMQDKVRMSRYLKLHRAPKAEESSDVKKETIGLYRKFTPADRLEEIERRQKANAEASESLGHPAMDAAMVFDSDIIAVTEMIGTDPAEMGCKWLFEAIAMRRGIINDFNAQIDDLCERRTFCKQDVADVKSMIRNAKKFDAEDDAECYRQIVYMDEAEYLDLCKEIRQIKKQTKVLEKELKVLSKGLKKIRSYATGTKLALIEARAKSQAKKMRDKKGELFGRPVNPADKPMLKGYKLMHFEAEETMSIFHDDVSQIYKAYNKYSDVMSRPDSTDDEKKAIKDNLIAVFNAVTNTIKQMCDSGVKLQLNAANAKVHNARQSQLTDVIGVPYGKTTDMIVSITHNIANVFNPHIAEAMSEKEDFSDGKKLVDDLCKTMVKIAKKNGYAIKMLPGKDGNSRVVEYLLWDANNTQLKLGKNVALSMGAYTRAAEVGRAGMSEAEYNEIWRNGSDYLKWLSYAMTPGCPMMYDGEPLTVNDVLVVKSIECLRKFRNVLMFDEEGSSKLMDTAELSRTAFDGSLYFLVPIRSQQMRGGFAFKGFGTCIAYDDGTTMIDEIAKREGWTVPDYIEDVDGVPQYWRNFKVICTEDCWKWAGWKFGESKRRFTYAEYKDRMNKLAEKYPAANKLYTARIADATEESKRRLTRQSIQQNIFASQIQLEKLYAKSIGKLRKWSTHDGVIRALAGLDKPEEERTAFEHLVEVCPEILDNEFMKRQVEDMYQNAVAEAAVRPEVNGIYPYITEDPVAFIKIVFWKADPRRTGIGYLTGGQVNAPQTADGKKMYLVRYPNNYICGRIRVNKNDEIYRCCGNVMIISLDGGLLIIADGDTDGDEMCAVFDEVVIEMMEEVLAKVKPPIIAFPHGKLKKRIIRDKNELDEEVASAIVIANLFGPEVGKNSNMATKFMNKAAVAYHAGKDWLFRTNLNNAIIAHIAAIIAIDLAKTGSMPDWLRVNLDAISKYAGKKMPWNQRFCKHNKTTPWFDKEYWDDKTLDEDLAVCNRGARYLINAVEAEDYVCPTGSGFDVHDILGDKTGLDVRGSSGKLNVKELRALEARNYKGPNEDGDNEFVIVQKLTSANVKDTVKPAELVRFLWRNQTRLRYTLQREGDDKLDTARMINSYYDFCRDLLIDFGSFCGNEAFMKKPQEVRRMSNVYKFVEMAFDKTNGVAPETFGKDGSILSQNGFSRKSSFAMFVVKVFSYDLYNMVCDIKGIQRRWVKPVAVDEAQDIVDYGEYDEECDYFEYDDCGIYGDVA